MEFLYKIFGLGAEQYNESLFTDNAPFTTNPSFSDLVGCYQVEGITNTWTTIWLAAATVGIAVLMSYLYYYVVDSPKFHRWHHWTLWTILSFLLVYGVAFWISEASASGAILKFAQQQKIAIDNNWWRYDITSLSNSLAMMVALWSLLVSILTLFIIRGRSINCRKTPF